MLSVEPTVSIGGPVLRGGDAPGGLPAALPTNGATNGAFSEILEDRVRVLAGPSSSGAERVRAGGPRPTSPELGTGDGESPDMPGPVSVRDRTARRWPDVGSTQSADLSPPPLSPGEATVVVSLVSGTSVDAKHVAQPGPGRSIDGGTAVVHDLVQGARLASVQGGRPVPVPPVRDAQPMPEPLDGLVSANPTPHVPADGTHPAMVTDARTRGAVTPPPLAIPDLETYAQAESSDRLPGLTPAPRDPAAGVSLPALGPPAVPSLAGDSGAKEGHPATLPSGRTSGAVPSSPIPESLVVDGLRLSAPHTPAVPTIRGGAAEESVETPVVSRASRVETNTGARTGAKVGVEKAGATTRADVPSGPGRAPAAPAGHRAVPDVAGPPAAGQPAPRVGQGSAHADIEHVPSTASVVPGLVVRIRPPAGNRPTQPPLPTSEYASSGRVGQGPPAALDVTSQATREAGADHDASDVSFVRSRRSEPRPAGRRVVDIVRLGERSVDGVRTQAGAVTGSVSPSPTGLSGPVPLAITPGPSPSVPTPLDQTLPPYLVRAARFLGRQGGGEARIRLHPEHLGEIVMTVKVDQGAVTAVLQVESEAARGWIRAHQELLRAALGEQGLGLDRFTVTERERRDPRDPRDPRDRRDEPRPRPTRSTDARFEIRV